jgi:putative ABC transport system permease protein
MTWWQDVRFGCRMLLSKPGFTAAAVLSIALGIGANTTIFSLVHGVLLAPLPYPHPERLAMIFAVPPNRPEGTALASPRDYFAWKDESHAFELVGMAVVADRDFGSEAGGIPAERIGGWEFSTSTLEILGAKAALGRIFTPEEDEPGKGATVLMISHALWQRRYGGDPNVIGKEVRLDGVPNTIIGVMPAAFGFWDRADYYKPNNFSPRVLENPAPVRFVYTLARLKPGVSFAQARAEMEALTGHLAEAEPERLKGWGVRVEPLQEALYGSWIRNALLVMEGVVGFVLLIACANVAGLLLARASSRRVEISVRAALGAGRRRILRQLLTESVLLALAGGVFGLLLAWWGVRVLVALSPAGLPRADQIRIDAPVLAFTALLVVVTGLLFGAVPAWQASKPDLVEALKDSPRGGATGFARVGFRSALVVLQIALALVLLVGAGLVMSSFIRLQTVDFGCDPKGVLTFALRLPNNRVFRQVTAQDGVNVREVSPQVSLLQGQICERIRAVPGVIAAAGVSVTSLQGAHSATFTIAGRPVPETAAEKQALSSAYSIVTPGYFAALRIPFVQGRGFSETDTLSSPWVAIVNETMARRFWPNESAIGKRLSLAVLPLFREGPTREEGSPREIVGIVADTPLSRRQTRPQPVLFVSYLQQAPQLDHPMRREMTYVVRSAGDPRRLMPTIARAAAEIEPNVPLTEVATMEEYLGEQIDTPRYFLMVLGVFAVIATLLAGVGIYGVMAWSVARRTHEIGIRMALGAGARTVLVGVLRSACVLAVAGLILGLAGSFALTRLIRSVLWGVTPTDPATFAGAAMLLAAVAVLAALVPALRAARLDPNRSLRHE